MLGGIRSITLDYTTLSLWRQCPQKFAYRMLMSLTGRGTSPALEFGKLVHLGLELANKYDAAPTPGAKPEAEYLAAHNPPRATDAPLLRVLNEVAIEAATTTIANLASEERRSLRHLLLLLIAYVENYYPDPCATKRTEQGAKAFLGLSPSGIRVYYKGTVDGIHDTGPTPYVIERKTSSYLNSGFLDRTNPNDQATGYLWLARTLTTLPITKVLFDGISTAGYGKSYGATTYNESRWTLFTKPGSCFMRSETQRTEADIAEWRERVLYDADRIAEDIRRGQFSKNAPDGCTTFASLCPYADLCRAQPDMRGILIQNTLVEEEWPGFSVNED